MLCMCVIVFGCTLCSVLCTSVCSVYMCVINRVRYYALCVRSVVPVLMFFLADLMNWISAMMKEPNAMDPRWFLQLLLIIINIILLLLLVVVVVAALVCLHSMYNTILLFVYSEAAPADGPEGSLDLGNKLNSHTHYKTNIHTLKLTYILTLTLVTNKTEK